MRAAAVVIVGGVLLGACAPRRVHEEPILRTGDRATTAASDAAVERAREQAERDLAAAREAQDQNAAHALADCAPALCAALARGEVVLGMSAAQVMAATGTTASAWSARQSGSATVLVPSRSEHAPRDGSGELAMVQLRDGRVTAFSYREAHGLRVVDDPGDLTAAGRAVAMADALVREADDLVARGALDLALNRYDRAQVLKADDPLLDYRIASILDRQLRPIEAQIRYELFLHRLELEKIRATGEAYGHLADAIAHARERIIVLEKQGR